MKFSKFIVCCFLFLALPYALNAQAKDAQKTPASLRGFVQGFYDWYVPKALGDNAGPAWDLVLRSRSSDLSPQLVQALREDLTAQAKAKGEIVGLDFDPFLNSQDPGERYEVGTITPKDGGYRVEIHGVWSGKKHEKTDVVAVVVQKNGRWLFVNFDYPEGRDLLAVLKSLRESRQKPTKG
jgi:hypothetical protein